MVRTEKTEVASHKLISLKNLLQKRKNMLLVATTKPNKPTILIQARLPQRT